MASPTRSEIETQIKCAVKILNETQKFCASNTPNYIAMESDLIENIESDNAASILASLNSFRSSLNNCLAMDDELLIPLIRDYSRLIGSPATDINSMLTDIFEYMHANSFAVQSRQFSFGSPSPSPSNVGTGTINRLVKDPYGYDIESCHAESKAAVCVADANSGASVHQETFEVRGLTAERDLLYISGSGLVQTIRALSARDSMSYIDNPSFESYSGSPGSITAITGWTPGASISNFDIETSVYYRSYAGVSTPVSLKIMGDDYLSQPFSERVARFDTSVPYYFQIAYNNSVGGVTSGTLSIDFGKQTFNANLASGSGWQILRLPLGTSNWFLNFNETDPEIRITVSGMNVGAYLLVDDIVLAPFTRVDGTWLAIVGGPTAFLVGDRFDWTDSEVGSVLQTWFWRAFMRYLPHATGGGVTWTDP